MTGERGTVTVTHVADTGTWLVVLEGEHDAFTAPMLHAQTDAVWSQAAHVVVDLQAAVFIDASVIRWLVCASRTLNANGATMDLVEDACGVASRVLDVTGLRRAIIDPAPAATPNRSSSPLEPSELA